MYGESINELIVVMSNFFELTNAKILLEDNGALPFVLAARFELAVKRLFPEINKEYLLPFNVPVRNKGINNLYTSKKRSVEKKQALSPRQ